MKEITSQTNSNLHLDLDIIDNIYLFKQFVVTSVSNSIITINGGNVDLFPSGSKVIFPFITGFNTEYEVHDSFIDHNVATVRIVNGTLPSDEYDFNNSYVAVKINITDKLVKNPISNIKQSIEGNDFSDFDSGYIEVVATNENGYFINRDKTGLFDSDDVFWLKYYTKFKGYNENWLVFGGLVKLSDNRPNLYDRTIKIVAYGHSYELDRYPAFYLMNEGNGILSKIGKFEVTNYFESDKSEEGIKKIEFEPFSRSELQGIYVQSVSEGTKSGIKVLEFRYPYYFRWDNGQWYSVTSNPSSGIKEMQAADGSLADIVVGTNSSLAEFPDKDAEIWVNVKNIFGEESSERLGEQGKPIVTFDNGFIEPIRTKFQRILKLSNGSYTDITFNINYENSISSILENENDSLIIISPTRFYGIEMLFNSFSSSSYSYTIHYSSGGEVFSSDFKADNSFSDGTNNFTENGKLRWGNVGNWVVNNIIADIATKYTGYMIKVTRTDSTGSAGLSLKSASRIMRAQGQDNDFIEFNIDKDGIIPKKTTDELLLRNYNGNWTFGTWYDSVTIEQIMEKFKDVSNYSDSSVVIDELSFSLSEPTFNIWGRVPFNGFIKNPSCYYIDWTNQYIYIALRLEVWRCKFDGRWEFVVTLDDQDLDDTSTYYHYIKYLMVTNNNLVTMIVTTTQKRLGLSSRTFVYQMDTGTKSLSYYINKEINDGSFATRYGRKYDVSGGHERRIGAESANNIKAGENMVFPFPQKVESDEWNYKLAFYPRTNLLEGDTADFPDWYLGNDNNDDGEVWQSKMGYYAIKNNAEDGNYPDPYEITFNFGFKNSVVFNIGAGIIYAFIQITNSQDNVYWQLGSINFPPTYPSHKLIRSRKGLVPNAVAGTYNGNDPLYFAWIESKDTDTQRIDSFISKAVSLNIIGTNLIPFRQVFTADSGMTVLDNFTDEVNNGSYLANILSSGESIVFSSDNKFKTIELDFEKEGTHPATNWTDDWILYYADENNNWIEYQSALFPDGDIYDDKYFALDIPEDWGTNVIFGYGIRLQYKGSANISLKSAKIAETIIWDSSSESDSERYSVVDMEIDTTNNVIFGCMFNRSNDHNNPFQWLLFVHDIENKTTEYIRTGSNFTFEGSFVYKNFEYDSDNDRMYFTAVNLRHRDLPSFIGYMKWNNGIVTVVKLDSPRENDYDSVPELQYNNGKLFGITAGTDFVLWEFAKEFNPRIEIAKFGNNDTLKSVLRYIAILKNFFYTIHPERKLRFISRENYNGSYYIDYDKHITKGKPEFNSWKHFYDSVIVKWQNPYTENNGEKKIGFDGWNREKFNLNNPLIQNKYMAAVIRDILYIFFNNHRTYVEKVKTINLPFLELLDRVGLFIPESFGDINNDLRYIIVTIETSSDKNIKIKLLERIGDSSLEDEQILFEDDIEEI